MNSSEQGRQAESVVAKTLKGQGHEIVELNWRTPKCEIDIVSTKKRIAYMTEVKYRSEQFQGTGLDYVTAKKQKQMQFAAESWVQVNGWTGDYRLMAAEVAGSNYEHIEIVEL